MTSQKMIFQAENELDKYKTVIAKQKAFYEQYNMTNWAKYKNEIMPCYNALPLADKLDVDNQVLEMKGVLADMNARNREIAEYQKRHCNRGKIHDFFWYASENPLVDAVSNTVLVFLFMGVSTTIMAGVFYVLLSLIGVL